MPTEKKTIENLRKCPKFNKCSINVCVLDIETNLRNKLSDEERCPFTINKKAKSQKGIKTQMPPHLYKFVPKLNLKMLNRRNQKRWHKLYKKDGR